MTSQSVYHVAKVILQETRSLMETHPRGSKAEPPWAMPLT